MENIAKTTHPLVLIAAASVTIASLAAAAHFTGLLPSKSEPPAQIAAAVVPPPPSMPPAPEAAKAETPPPAVAPQPAAEAPPAPAPARHASKPHRTTTHAGAADRVYDGSDPSATRRVATGNDAGIDVIQSRPPQITNQGPATSTASAPPVCHDCGTVENVQEVTVKGQGTGLGAVAGGVLGGVLGHQVGRGSGKDLMTIAGAVGGAFAGHQVEKNVRAEKEYQVTVRFDDGNTRTFTQKSTTGWRNGDRVRLDNGSLRLM